MKAWIVSDEQRGNAVVVFAERPGRAKAAGASWLEVDGGFVGVCMRRAPELDAFAARGLTLPDLLRAGWHFECSSARCPHPGRFDRHDLKGGADDGVQRYGRAFCSVACADAWDAEGWCPGCSAKREACQDRPTCRDHSLIAKGWQVYA